MNHSVMSSKFIFVYQFLVGESYMTCIKTMSAFTSTVVIAYQAQICGCELLFGQVIELQETQRDQRCEIENE